MPCAGASDEQCGNGYKSSLYTSVSSVVSPLGCYKDSTPRILPDYSYKSSSMTPLLCQSTCMSKGYSFAGQYNGRCDINYLTRLSVVSRCLVRLRMLLRFSSSRRDRKDSKH